MLLGCGHTYRAGCYRTKETTNEDRCGVQAGRGSIEVEVVSIRWEDIESVEH